MEKKITNYWGEIFEVIWINMASKSAAILLGQCVPCIKNNASKIRIRRMVLDNNLNMVNKITSNFMN